MNDLLRGLENEIEAFARLPGLGTYVADADDEEGAGQILKTRFRRVLSLSHGNARVYETVRGKDAGEKRREARPPQSRLVLQGLLEGRNVHVEWTERLGREVLLAFHLWVMDHSLWSAKVSGRLCKARDNRIFALRGDFAAGQEEAVSRIRDAKERGCPGLEGSVNRPNHVSPAPKVVADLRRSLTVHFANLE